jgi:LacI family transcriptional regulator, galactose operon repressor
MTGRKVATMLDVAREAGVSRAAVSKVIRNAYGVSSEMRERVEAAIAHLDYRPSVAARAIRGSSFTLGFQLHELENPALARILRGAARATEGTGYQLVVAPAATPGEREGYRALEALVDLHVDGIVAVASAVSSEWLEELSGRVPIVMLSRHDDSVGYDTMTGDDAAGTALAMKHLLSLGHQRIAHLTRDEEATAPGLGTPPAVRLAAYRDLMTTAGHAGRIDVIRAARGDVDGRRATLARLQEPDRPTAILAINDDHALGALHALRELGLSTSDVSIVGYDNIRLAAHPLISLTTVDQSGDELGERAVGMLIERIGGRTTARHESTTPRLHVRGSTTAP